MWPRSIERGINQTTSAIFLGLPSFNVAALDRARHDPGPDEPRNPSHASMWPRSIERGIRGTPQDAIGAYEASMWPRSIERGIDPRRRLFHRHAVASMWPRSIERGIMVDH